MAATNFKKLLAATVIAGAIQCISFSETATGAHTNGAEISPVYKICNGEHASVTFSVHLDYLIDQLIINTPNTGYDYYYTQHDAHGHAACNGKLSKSDCTDCLSQASDAGCSPLRIGAQVQLVDCRMRYEKYPFVE